MNAVASGRLGSPAAALFVARIVYAFNWYNVGAVLPLIGISLSAGTAQLGVVLGAFLVGVGLFQIPAGLAAVRFGARRVSLLGLTVLALAGIASAFSPTYIALAGFRFVAGIGAAFFFAPGLSLVASYYPPGRRGPVIGLYNGGFSIGGAVGLFGGAVLGEWGGWPLALGAGGAALLATTALAWLILPVEPPARSGSPDSLRSVAGGVLRSRGIWALSLALTGFWAAMFSIAQYFVQYGHDAHPEWGAGVAAALAAGLVIISFPGGPIGGWIAERGGDRRAVVGIFAAAASLLVLAIPALPLWALWADMLILGVVDGVIFAVLYLIPTYLVETRGEGLALGVAVINSIQVLLGSALAIAFGLIASRWGFSVAWESSALLCAGLLPLLVLVPRGERTAPPPLPQGDDRRASGASRHTLL